MKAKCLQLGLFLVGAASIGLPLALPAQVNSWTNPASAAWHEPFWDVGLLPGPGQSVFITNAGWKAVGIHPYTRDKFPETLTVSNLTVSAPSNSWSTLLLNYSGETVPLRIRNKLILGPNARLEDLYGALEVAPWAVCILTNAEFSVEGGSILASNVWVDIDGTTCNFKDARTSWSYLHLGSFAETSVAQVGGSLETEQLTLGGDLRPNATPGGPTTYNLTNGVLKAGRLYMGLSQKSLVNQVNGSVTADVEIGGAGNGEYYQWGGEVAGSELRVGSRGGGGTFIQNGGTNRIEQVCLDGQWSSANYTTIGGRLESSALTCSGRYGNATFSQNGGVHISTGTIALSGQGVSMNWHGYGQYFVQNGTLEAAALSLQYYSAFGATHSTVRFDGAVSITGAVSRYGPGTAVTLSGGSLSCSALNSMDAEIDVRDASLVISNGLSFGGHSMSDWPYLLATMSVVGGSLSASDIEIKSYLSLEGTKIHNPGVFRLAGSVYFGVADAQLGRLQTETSPYYPTRDPGIGLGGTGCVLRFLASHNEHWNSARLNVLGWGPGKHLFIGTDASGLRNDQLQKIQFVDPSGFPAGTYKSVMLPSGEIVPTASVAISSVINGWFVLSWPTNAVLQSSTNVSGPYSDLLGADPPYSVQVLGNPSRFFRLRVCLP